MRSRYRKTPVTFRKVHGTEQAQKIAKNKMCYKDIGPYHHFGIPFVLFIKL